MIKNILLVVITIFVIIFCSIQSYATVLNIPNEKSKNTIQCVLDKYSAVTFSKNIKLSSIFKSLQTLVNLENFEYLIYDIDNMDFGEKIKKTISIYKLGNAYRNGEILLSDEDILILEEYALNTIEEISFQIGILENDFYFTEVKKYLPEYLINILNILSDKSLDAKIKLSLISESLPSACVVTIVYFVVYGILANVFVVLIPILIYIIPPSLLFGLALLLFVLAPAFLAVLVLICFLGL